MNTAFKFKHLFGEQLQQQWKNAKPSSQIYESNILKVNKKYIGYIPDLVGGVVTVFDMHKNTQVSEHMPNIIGHEGPIYDFEFMPYNDQYLATTGNDSKVKIWKIPEEFTKNLTQPETTLQGHQGKCILLQFNASAEGILASTAYDKQVCVWDIIKSSSLVNIHGSDKDYCTSLNWNPLGSLLATGWKDKHLRIIDPRAKSISAQTLSHEALKSQKAVWMGQHSDLITSIGYNSQHQREIKLWDLKKIEQPIETYLVDNLSAILYPFYDQDLNVLYLSAKGETSIKYYEFINGQYVNFQNDYKSATQSKSVAFVPKQCLDSSVNEIARFLKLTESSIEQVQFKIPRKAQTFQSDLFPDTYYKYQVNNEQWESGVSKEPLRIGLDPSQQGATQHKNPEVEKHLVIAKQVSSEPEIVNNNHQQQMQQQHEVQQQQHILKDNIVANQKFNELQDTFQKQQVAFEQKKMNFENEKEILNQKIVEMKQQNIELDRKAQQMKDAAEDIAKQNQELTVQQQSKEKNVQKSAEQIQTLQSQLEQLTKENQCLKKENGELAEKNQQAKEVIENGDLVKRFNVVKNSILQLKEASNVQISQEEENVLYNGNVYDSKQFREITEQVQDLKQLVDEISKQ